MFQISALLLMIVSLMRCEFPKIFWAYWDGDYNLPFFQIFKSNHQRMMSDGWEVRVINDTTIQQYLDEIPYYQGDFFTINYIQQAHKSDYVRCLLLSFYGGVYIDFSSILIEDFSWLEFDNLRSNPSVLNKFGDEPEVVLFTNVNYDSKEQYYDTRTQRNFQVSPGYQIWFIAAVPNSTFLREYLPILRQGFYDEVVTIEGQHKYIDKLIDQYEVQQGTLRHSFYLSSLQLVKIQMRKKQIQLDKKAKQSNTQRYLASWHYKIWHIWADRGPFSILKQTQFHQAYFFTRYNVEALSVIFHRPTKIRYFFKLVHPSRTILQNFMIPHRSVDYGYCPRLYYVNKGSVVHKYLIENTTFGQYFEVSESPYRTIFDIDCYRRIEDFAFLTLYYWLFGELFFVVLGILTLLLLIFGVWIYVKIRKNKKNLRNITDDYQKSNQIQQIEGAQITNKNIC